MKIKKPAVILVRPQLPENIGMVARVMQNFNLKELILVAPREKWPNKKSFESSKQARVIIKNTKIFNNLEEAIQKFNIVIATTNRKRFLEKKKIISYNYLSKLINSNKNSAILFGPENSGLSNEDLRLVDYLFTINTANNKSLNLSHAVTVICFKIYEEYLNNLNKKNSINFITSTNSNKKELNYFMKSLIEELNKVNFFHPETKKQSMIDNIYSIFLKASLTKKELNTLWGMLKKLRN